MVDALERPSSERPASERPSSEAGTPRRSGWARPTTGKGGDAGGKVAQSVLDGGEVFLAAAAILTVERLLLGVVLSITWHDTR